MAEELLRCGEMPICSLLILFFSSAYVIRGGCIFAYLKNLNENNNRNMLNVEENCLMQ